MKKHSILFCLLLLFAGFGGMAQGVFEKFANTSQNTVTDQDVLNRTLITDDLYVQGSQCLGFDCANNSAFGSDTFILRENNLRIYFDDTSNTGSFPGNDWRLTANDQTNGGANYFGIDDATAGTRPFRVDAGAGNNALYIESGGNVGFGNNNPTVDVHITTGDTPELRLEQNGTSGFTPQTWDIAGNETNFFIRDVTNGSALPFKIQPGADDNTFHIASTGNVGIGTGSLNNVNDNASLELGATDKGLQLNRLTNAQRGTLGGALGATEVGVIVYDTEDDITYAWDGTQWNPIGADTDDQTVDVFQLNANNLELSLEDDGAPTLQVDLSGYLDNTDDQEADVFQLNGNDLELSLENDGAPTQQVDLSVYLDNTDDQVADVFQLNGNNLELSLENDGAATQQVDLSGYLDNTDDQVADVFQLNGNDLELSLENDGAPTQQVDLSVYLDNTDNQNISGSGLAANILTIGISGGTSENVDLSSLDNPGTDDQQLSLNGNSLDLEDGGSVDLSGYLDNTDDQVLGNFILSNRFLSLTIEDGNGVLVDLGPLLVPLEDENAAQQAQIDALIANAAAQQAQIDDLIARVEALEDCACTLENPDGPETPGRRTAHLFQNVPNPFGNTTTIGYYIPFTHEKANLIISTTTGKLISNMAIRTFGEGSIEINKSSLQSAMYFYTLYVDGRRVDTKRMLVE